jgi:hypothetical protein
VAGDISRRMERGVSFDPLDSERVQGVVEILDEDGGDWSGAECI